MLESKDNNMVERDSDACFEAEEELSKDGDSENNNFMSKTNMYQVKKHTHYLDDRIIECKGHKRHCKTEMIC